MFKLALLILVATSGCLDDTWVMPKASVYSVADDATQARAWDDRVAIDVGTWNKLLTARGCPAPFEFASVGHPIRLVARASWEDSGDIGSEDHDSILIRSSPDNSPPPVGGGTLLHELGHAMGMEHTNPADGPSIMLPVAGTQIMPRDLDTAAALLGC